MNEINEVVEQEQQVVDDASNPFGEQRPEEEYRGDVALGQSPESETYQVDWEAEAKKFHPCMINKHRKMIKCVRI